jgi:hypothetical protein
VPIADDLQHRLTHIAESLTDPASETIDLDVCAEICREASVALTISSQLEQNYRLLRTDLESRIAGMLKGMAVAARSRGELREVEQEVAFLGTLDDDELLSQANRVAARFRGMFPNVLMPRYDQQAMRTRL